jgi:hypothetical protein
MAGYVYNPAESITQSLQQAQSGLGNMFTQIIAQQQRDYNLAESALNNAEALKKNLGLFGSKEITDGANQILGQVTSAITKNGRLDFSKLGAVRQQISDLSDLKSGYDNFTKNVEQYTQLGASMKDNLTSYESFYRNIIGLASNKALIANPNDMSKAMGNVLTQHLNTNKMGIEAIRNVVPLLPVVGQYTPQGTKQEVTYTGSVFEGVTVGPDGKLIKPSDPTYYETVAQKIKVSNPDVLEAERKKQGVQGVSTVSDAAIVKSWFDSMPGGEVRPSSIKSERDVKREEAQTEMIIFENKVKGKVLDAKLQSQKIQDALNLANISRLRADAAQMRALQNATPNTFKSTFPVKTIKDGKPVEVGQLNARGTDLGTGIQMVVPTSSGTKNLDIKQVFFDKNGDARVSYLEKLPVKKATGGFTYLNMSAPGENSWMGTPSSGTTPEKVNFARVPRESVPRFLSTLQSNLRKEYTDDKDFMSIWKDVQATFAPYKSSGRVSGEIIGETVYLDRAYEPSADKIMKDYGAKRVVYLDE